MKEDFKNTKKEFQKWHKRKAFLHEDKQRPFFHEGEVWVCALGLNIGFEQDGRGEEFLRPIVIIRKFNQQVCWGLPLTKNKKKGKYYFSFKLNGTISTAILSQIRLVDSKRLQYKIGALNHEDFCELTKKLKELIP